MADSIYQSEYSGAYIDDQIKKIPDLVTQVVNANKHIEVLDKQKAGIDAIPKSIEHLNKDGWIQADWEQTDRTQPDYIKNKPINSSTDFLVHASFSIDEDGNITVGSDLGFEEIQEASIASCNKGGAVRFCAIDNDSGKEYMGFLSTFIVFEKVVFIVPNDSDSNIIYITCNSANEWSAEYVDEVISGGSNDFVVNGNFMTDENGNIIITNATANFIDIQTAHNEGREVMFRGVIQGNELLGFLCKLNSGEAVFIMHDVDEMGIVYVTCNSANEWSTALTYHVTYVNFNLDDPQNISADKELLEIIRLVTNGAVIMASSRNRIFSLESIKTTSGGVTFVTFEGNKKITLSSDIMFENGKWTLTETELATKEYIDKAILGGAW